METINTNANASTLVNETAEQASYDALMAQYTAIDTATKDTPNVSMDTSLLGLVGDVYRTTKYIAGGIIHVGTWTVRNIPAAVKYAAIWGEETVIAMEAAIKDLTPEQIDQLNAAFDNMSDEGKRRVHSGTIRRMIKKISAEL